MKQNRFVKRWVWLGAMLTLMAVPLTSMAQDSAPSLPAGVQDIVRLVKAGLSEQVVLAQINHVGATYSLSADQIIYLHKQGVTPNEISALLGTGNAPAPSAPMPSPQPLVAPAPVVANPSAPPPPQPAYAVPAVAPAPVTPGPTAPVPVVPVAPMVSAATSPSLDTFQAQLASYGTWTDVPGYGLCWRPAVELSDPYWRPYCDNGYWDYTDSGWTWQSGYSWGATVFHYGRWYRDGLGWVWVPGYDWAPAWVCWRQAEGYCGWAPLPPGAVYRAGVGLWFNGHVAVDVDFGLGPDAFTFVAYDHFWDHHLHAYLLPRERLGFVFGHSVIMNGYRFDHGRFFVEGLGREHMALLTHHEIRDREVMHDDRFRGEFDRDHGRGWNDRRDHRGW